MKLDLANCQRIRELLLAALEAGLHGEAPALEVWQAVATGRRDLTLEQLNFDSLAWMEFCISIELQSGQELTPAHLANMRHFYEIEDWLRTRC